MHRVGACGPVSLHYEPYPSHRNRGVLKRIAQLALRSRIQVDGGLDCSGKVPVPEPRLHELAERARHIKADERLLKSEKIQMTDELPVIERSVPVPAQNTDQDFKENAWLLFRVHVVEHYIDFLRHVGSPRGADNIPEWPVSEGNRPWLRADGDRTLLQAFRQHSILNSCLGSRPDPLGWLIALSNARRQCEGSNHPTGGYKSTYHNGLSLSDHVNKVNYGSQLWLK
jgi:hypothetical protein